jgi:cell division protein FtsQ
MIAAGLIDRLGRRGGRRPPRGRTRRGSRRAPLGVLTGWLTTRAGKRVAIGLVALLVLLGGAWLWLRDSSLVAVKRVSVTGASGPDAGAIRSALATAARNMTTLHVKMTQLDLAVEPYPVVKSIQVSTQFPHGMQIHVTEEIPVAAIDVGGRNVAVAGDGTLLKDGSATAPLPLIPLRFAPGGPRLSDPAAMRAVRLLAAAPYPLLDRASQATTSAAHGLEVQLRNGPSIYFGADQQLGEKWTAAAAVLADSRSAGAQYIDVSDPVRPAAGATPSSSSPSSSAATGASPPATATVPAGIPTTPSGG